MCENNAHFVFFIKRRVSFFKLCTFRFAVITFLPIASSYAAEWGRQLARPLIHVIS